MAKTPPVQDRQERVSGLRRRRALRITLLHLLEAMALVLVLAVVAFSAIAWRLSKGPVPLAPFRKDAETALVSTFGGEAAHVGKLQIAWSREERALVISASDVQIDDKDGKVMLSIPRFEAGLSGLGLVQGKIEFSRIVAYGGELSIVRREDGAIGMGPGNVDQVLGNAKAWQRRSGINAPLMLRAISKLQYMAIRNSRLHAEDFRSGVIWSSNDASLRFARQGNMLRLSGGGSIASVDTTEENPTPQQGSFSISGNSRPDLSRMFLEVSLKQIVPSRFVPETGPLAFMHGFDFPLTSHAVIVTGENGLLNQFDLDLDAGAGTLRVGKRAEKLQSARLSASYNATSGKVEVQEGEVRAANTRMEFTGSVQGVDPARLVVGDTVSFGLHFKPLQVDLTGFLPGIADLSAFDVAGMYNSGTRTLGFTHLNFQTGDLQFSGNGGVRWVDVPGRERPFPEINLVGTTKGSASVGRVLSLWPLQVGEGARSWAAHNMQSGNISNLVLDLHTNPKVLEAGGLENDMLSLSFNFSGIKTGYFMDMPPLRNLQGTALLRGNSFAVQIKSGKLLDLDLSKGTVNMPYLHPSGAPAVYKVHAEGPISSVLEVLNHKPFAYASQYGITPDLTGGSGALDLSITRPMRTKVPYADMQFAVDGKFSQVKIPALIFDQDLGKGDMTIHATEAGMKVSGKAQFAGQGVDFSWEENFKAKTTPRTTMDIKGQVQVGLFDAIGLPSRGWFDGTAGLHLHTVGNGLQVSDGKVDLDLTQSSLTIPIFDWHKASGVPGNLSFQLAEGAGGLFSLKGLDLSTAGMDVQGSADFSKEIGLVDVRLDRAKVAGGFDLTADLTRGQNGEFLIRADIHEGDISRILQSATLGGEGAVLPYKAEISFDTLVAGERLTLQNGNLQIDQRVQNGENLLEALSLQAETAKGPVQVSISRASPTARDLNAMAPDGGALLNALYGIKGVAGGKFSAHGTLQDDRNIPDKVVLELKSFRLENTPVVAKLLSLGSLTGFADTLSGTGMAFNELTVPMEMQPGQLTIRGAHATGPAMGVTMDGDIDLKAKSLLLEGSLAPSYTLNSILGYIPIMGDILVPRQGEGVFGLTYKVEGPFSKMAVSVNPLSAFAPGVLRQMFGGKLPERKTKAVPAQTPMSQDSAPVTEKSSAGSEELQPTNDSTVTTPVPNSDQETPTPKPERPEPAVPQ